MSAAAAPAAAAAVPKEQPTNKIGIGLGLGIIFFPVIFAWFTLRKGHGVGTRVAAFGWLAIVMMVWASNRGEQSLPAASANASASMQQASAALAEPSEAPPPADRNKTIGQRFVLGDFAYTVDGIEGSTSIGKSYGKKEASEGAAFLIVDFTIENLGKETETVMTNDFKIVDANGRQFRSSSEGNTALMMSGAGKDFIISELHPGIQKKMKTVFEVPISLLEQGMTLVIPEKGFGGNDEAHIQLSAGKN
jgi:hypothetical protein